MKDGIREYVTKAWKKIYNIDENFLQNAILTVF